MRAVSDVKTYTLLLRELSTGVSKSALITGKEGALDGVALAAFFAGVARVSFPGGIYLVAPQLSDLKSITAELCDKATGRKLLIVSDANFGEGYSIAVNLLTNDRQDVSVIIISRNSEYVTGDHFSINLNDSQPSSEATITKLYDQGSGFDEPPYERRVQDN